MALSKIEKVLESLIRQEIESYLRENKKKFRRIDELESATNAADDQKVSALKQKKADLEKKAAQNDGEIAKIKQQIDAIEKK
jgi:hypothetical protein